MTAVVPAKVQVQDQVKDQEDPTETISKLRMRNMELEKANKMLIRLCKKYAKLERQI